MKIDVFSDEIMKQLKEYKNEIDEAMKEEIDAVAKDALKNLKENPNIPVQTGEYKKGFRKKLVADGMGYRRVKISNKKYQLTHLLEYGHATMNGGRTKAYPHWSEAQKIAETLPERVKKRLEK